MYRLSQGLSQGNQLVSNKSQHKQLTRLPSIVSVGNFYGPSLLPDYSPAKPNLTRDKLTRHNWKEI